MLIFEDVLGTVVPAYVEELEETFTLNEVGQVSFSMMDRNENFLAYSLLVPETKITVPESKQIYRISTNNGVSIGKYKKRTITALHIAHDLHKKYVEKKLNGSQSLEACLGLLLSETPFSYVLHDTFKHYAFSEGFGGGFADTLFLNTLSKDFNFDFKFDNYVIHIYRSMGKRKAFIFVDGGNSDKISESSDYSTITTHIKGIGKKDDNGTLLAQAEYTSPLAKTYGKIDAQFIEDDRFTNSESLLAYLKSKVQDYPMVQYTVEEVVLKNVNLLPHNQSFEVGDYGFLRDRFDVDVETQINSIKTYPQDNRSPKITFGNKRMSLTRLTIQLTKDKNITKQYLTTFNGIVLGNQKEVKKANEKADEAMKLAEVAAKGKISGQVVKEL